MQEWNRDYSVSFTIPSTESLGGSGRENFKCNLDTGATTSYMNSDVSKVLLENGIAHHIARVSTTLMAADESRSNTKKLVKVE